LHLGNTVREQVLSRGHTKKDARDTRLLLEKDTYIARGDNIVALYFSSRRENSHLFKHMPILFQFVNVAEPPSQARGYPKGN